MELKKTAVAGTVESGGIMVTIDPIADVVMFRDNTVIGVIRQIEED